MSASKRTLAEEVASLRALVGELEREGKPAGLARLQLVAADLEEMYPPRGGGLEMVVGRLSARYPGDTTRPALTLIPGGRDA